MREIKFRAWESMNSEMVYFDGFAPYTIEDVWGSGIKLFALPFGQQAINDGSYCCMNLDSLIIMQCIGLKDKHGREIYEGDIVKEVYVPLGNNKEAYEYSRLHEVKYVDNCFGLVAKKDQGKRLVPEKCYEHQKDYSERYKHPMGGFDWFDYHLTPFRLEVIGNIYENSELLNNQDK